MLFSGTFHMNQNRYCFVQQKIMLMPVMCMFVCQFVFLRTKCCHVTNRNDAAHCLCLPWWSWLLVCQPEWVSAEIQSHTKGFVWSTLHTFQRCVCRDYLCTPQHTSLREMLNDQIAIRWPDVKAKWMAGGDFRSNNTLILRKAAWVNFRDVSKFSYE